MKAIDFFNAMMQGKKVRLNKAGREFWKQHGKKTWSIVAIHLNNEVTLFADNHTILRNVDFEQIESL